MGLTQLVACPRCRGALAEQRGLVCTSCEHQVPSIGGIPVLVEEPDVVLSWWGRNAHVFDRDMRLGLDQLLSEFTTLEPGTLTRARLETLHLHLGRHRQRLIELLETSGVACSANDAVAGDHELVLPSLLEYYVQIHRDWGWDDGSSEHSVATEIVGEAVGDRPLGKMLVLGAGACRLTEELHHRHAATVTLALDVDPLPFLVARKILDGETVKLYEFPHWPIDSKQLFADRALSSPRGRTADVHLVFANGLDPPVPRETFDTVFTPWFIDQIPENMEQLFETIRELLVAGGRWVNFGPLLYRQEHTDLPYRYCMDEVLDLVASTGFRVERHSFRRYSYLESPIGCQGRTERVLTFSAEKLPEKPSRARLPDPAWLQNAALAIPKPPGLAAYRGDHPMFDAVATAIDGRRSASDIAELMIERHGLPRDSALPGVQACLGAIFRELRG